LTNKTSHRELELHSLIQKDDDVALMELFEIHGETIMIKLKSWYKSVLDEALILEAVNEAFFGYYKNPNTFNPKKGTLSRFLEVAAERDLKNILQKENRRGKKIDLPEDVELQEKMWNSILSESEASDSAIVMTETYSKVEEFLQGYFLNSVDVELARLILMKERANTEFVKVLNIDSLSPQDQTKEVKRNKDRIKKVISRNNIEEQLRAIIYE